MNDHLVIKGTTLAWNLEPGQIVLRFPQDTFDRYQDITGISIPPGVVAHIVDNGEEETIHNGVYSLGKKKKKKAGGSTAKDQPGILQRLFERKKRPQVAPIPLDQKKAAKRAPGSSGPDVTLAWTGPFRTSLSLSNVEIGPAKYSIEIAIQLQVESVSTLARVLPPGEQVYRSNDIGRSIAPLIEGQVRGALRGRSYDELRSEEISVSLDQQLNGLKEEVAAFGLTSLGIVAVRIVDETQEKLVERDRKLDHREQDLQRTIRENGFLNQLAQEDNRRQIDKATTQSELDKALADIDDKNLLTEADREKIRRKIEFDRKVAAASDAKDLEKALGEAERDRLLNDDQLETFRADMERSESDRTTALELHQLGNQRTIDQLQREILHERELAELDHQHRKSMQAATNDLERRNLEDEYKDKRRAIDADFEKQRAEEEDTRAHEKKRRQIEILREAEAVREEREARKHDREMESARLETEAEQQRLSAFGSMSADQIMAANPNIQPAAAEALAQFWSAKNSGEQTELIRELLEKKNDDMQRFVEKQMELTRDLASGGAERGLSKSDVEAFLSVVKEKSSPSGASPSKKSKKGTGVPSPVCPSCGKKIPGDAAFCPYCGDQLG